MKIHTLYHVGYNNVKDISLLQAFTETENAIIADVRFRPRSRISIWNKGKLLEALPGHYLHIPELGNENYQEGPIKIVDIEKGVQQIMTALEFQPVAIMCACWNYADCHRREIVELIERRYGIEAVNLTAKILKEIAERSKPKQMDLFDPGVTDADQGNPSSSI